MPYPVIPLAVRFWAKVKKTKTCWLWTGCVLRNGYGCIGEGKPSKKNVKVHRVAWKLAGRKLVEGFTIDHLCNTKLCVNVSHLRQVSGPVNSRRYFRELKHCKRGHPFIPENTRLQRNKKGYLVRVCSMCARMHSRRFMNVKNPRVHTIGRSYTLVGLPVAKQ